MFHVIHEHTWGFLQVFLKCSWKLHPLMRAFFISKAIFNFNFIFQVLSSSFNLLIWHDLFWSFFFICINYWFIFQELLFCLCSQPEQQGQVVLGMHHLDTGDLCWPTLPTSHSRVGGLGSCLLFGLQLWLARRTVT